ncbi:MAG: diguanylate cyclase [Treponema sp.]
MIYTFFIFIFDMLGMIFKERTGKLSFYIPLISNTIFFILSGIIGMYWFLFIHYYCSTDVSTEFNNNFSNTKISFYCLIPVILLTICCLVSIKTKWIFYIDPSDNSYHRGSLFIIQQVIVYSFFTMSIIKALHFLITNKNSSKRYTFMALLFFVFLPIISGIISLFIVGVNVIWVSLTLALLFIYTNMKFSQISIDELTKLNNRKQFNDFIVKILSQKTHSLDIYLYMRDVNSFKKINDSFGHLEGDNALINAANILRASCHNENVFLARYGGDEFVAVYQCENKKQAESLKLKIQTAFSDYNKSSHKTYNISISIGYAKYTSTNGQFISCFIKDADNSLYQEKHKFYSGNK